MTTNRKAKLAARVRSEQTDEPYVEARRVESSRFEPVSYRPMPPTWIRINCIDYNALEPYKDLHRLANEAGYDILHLDQSSRGSVRTVLMAIHESRIFSAGPTSKLVIIHDVEDFAKSYPTEFTVLSQNYRPDVTVVGIHIYDLPNSELPEAAAVIDWVNSKVSGPMLPAALKLIPDISNPPVVVTYPRTESRIAPLTESIGSMMSAPKNMDMRLGQIMLNIAKICAVDGKVSDFIHATEDEVWTGLFEAYRTGGNVAVRNYNRTLKVERKYSDE